MIEIVVDNFAGGGGASVGIARAIGRHCDYAINHDREAIAMYKANHPTTECLTESVWNVDPYALLKGRRISDAWFSPDCTFHSKARGGKPFRDPDEAKRVRGLADVITDRWASLPHDLKPRRIYLENVEEFRDWGPLDDDGKPIPEYKGFLFRQWWHKLQDCGYEVQMRELRACDYGAPTSRKRLFIIARCDGLPIRWPAAMFGPLLTPYRTAADCIDWSLPIPSIFLTKNEAKQWAEIHGWKRPPRRPLEEPTLRRIARGTFRYVLNNPRPFIVPLTHQGSDRVHSADEPFRVITGAHRGEFALCAPTLIQVGWGEREGQKPRCLDLQQPLGVIMGQGNKHALVAAFLARHYGGHENDGAPPTLPFHTITAQDHHALATAHIVKLKGTCKDGQAADVPLHTIQASGTHYGLVRAFLMKYYGTDQRPEIQEPLPVITTKDRFGLVTVASEDYALADIGMRMFTARELFRAQGFPPSYIIDPFVTKTIRGRGVTMRLTSTAQIRMCGNSVPPPVAEAIVRANYVEQSAERAA